MSKKKLTKEEIEDIEYVQKRIFDGLKIPPHLQGTKEELEKIGATTSQILKKNKNKDE